MLLNASHEITNCGLPQHVQERYVRYKQGNRAIVAWMTKHGPERFKGRKTLPIKQLVALGQILCNKVQDIGALPSDVDYYFKEVIKERGYLSQHFRSHRDQCEKDEIDTINHEHFTESLKKIHEILLTAGKKNTKPRTQNSVEGAPMSSSSTTSVPEINNSFTHLLANTTVEQSFDESDEEALSDVDTDATSECSHSPFAGQTCICEDDGDNTDFLDTEGEIGVAIEVMMFADNIKRIANSIRNSWTKAGSGEVSVAAAAAYTNVLISKAATCARSFEESEQDQSALLKIRSYLENLSNSEKNPDYVDRDTDMDTLDALNRIHKTLVETQTLQERSKDSESPKSPHAISTRMVTQDTLIQCLILDLQNTPDVEPRSAITLQGLSFLGRFDALPNESLSDTRMLEACTTVYLIVISHFTYSESIAQPNRIAVPRISALQLANEAVAYINKFANDKTIFPCQCINTLGYRIVQMWHDLRAFAQYRCWNVLMQSPGIAGNHILEILDLCSYYGMHLFHYRQYVAAVLHTYQALVQLKYFERIPILEEVCDLFVPVLYTTGVRPETGFMASWLRYTGARLKFRRGKEYQDHRDTWCMSIPAHAAARSAGLNIVGKNEGVKLEPKFDYGILDSTIKLKREGWILSREAAELLDRDLEGNKSGVASLSETVQKLSEKSLTAMRKPQRNQHKRTKSCHVRANIDDPGEGDQCLKLEHELYASFTVNTSERRRLPASRVNLLSLFHSMTKVVSGVSDTTHAEDNNGRPKQGKEDGRGQMCLCFVQTILRAADRICDVRKRSGFDAKGAVWGKNEKECIECFKEHLMKMLDDAKVLDGSCGNWLWSGI